MRRGYLWMLVVERDTVEPDRMVLRWPIDHGAEVTPDQARDLPREIAWRLRAQADAKVAMWEVDHAIWRASRSTS